MISTDYHEWDLYHYLLTGEKRVSIKIRTTTTDPHGGVAAIEAARQEAATKLGAAPDQIDLVGTSTGHEPGDPTDTEKPEHWWFESTWAHMP